jgi:uncharacterized protein YbjT (DUF2867 family)
MMRVLITGGTGLNGKQLSKKLIETGLHINIWGNQLEMFEQ